MEMIKIGRVNHYYGKIGVAIIELTGVLKVGDHIIIRGTHTGFEQVVSSMQVEHTGIDEAKPGDLVGLKVKEKVREGDAVYKPAE